MARSSVAFAVWLIRLGPFKATCMPLLLAAIQPLCKYMFLKYVYVPLVRHPAYVLSRSKGAALADRGAAFRHLRALQDRERCRTGWRRERRIELPDHRGDQTQVGSFPVVAYVCLACRLGNRAYAGLTEQPGQRDLSWSCAYRFGKRVQAAITQQPASTHRRIRHHRDVVLPTKRKEIPFDSSAAEVIHHLICRATRSVRQRKQLLHVGVVEIGNPPIAYEAIVAQRLECIDRLGEWNVPAPVQEVEIEAIDAKPLQAALACSDSTAPAGMMRINLADHECLLAPRGDRLADDLFGSAVGIHLGGVDQGHPQIEPKRNGGDFLLPVASMLAHHPSAETERWHLGPGTQR